MHVARMMTLKIEHASIDHAAHRVNVHCVAVASVG